MSKEKNRIPKQIKKWVAIVITLLFIFIFLLMVKICGGNLTLLEHLASASLPDAPVKNFDNFIVVGVLIFYTATTILGLFLIVYKKFGKLTKAPEKCTKVLKTIASALVLDIFIMMVLLDLKPYVVGKVVTSSYIEDNYENPYDSGMVLTGKEKRNLILLNLESMESSYGSINIDGLGKQNLIPNLSKLAEDEFSFTSNDSKGETQMYADYTFASMVAVTSGVPLKNETNSAASNFFETHLTETSMSKGETFGDFLESEGYKNVAVMGASAVFGGKGKYLEAHGNYEMYDYDRAVEEGFVPETYCENWGLEDKKVFEWSKEILSDISKDGVPFNIIIETSDTHFPEGYECDLCENKYKSKTANAIMCDDRQIFEFVEWCKQQPWYENTTIVLLGDHLYMGRDLYGLSSLKGRKIYNCFVNLPEPLKEKEIQKQRAYTTFDMCPTILRSMGYEANGHRVGIGTDLFSDTETLAERDGYDFLYNELMKKSVFFNELQ